MMNATQNRMEKTFRTLIRFSKPLLLLLFVLLLCSGVYKVENGEVAVVLRFGRLTGENPGARIKQPGLHFAFPYVIDEVVKIPVGKIHQVTVKTHSPNTSAIVSDITKNGYLITGDSNIILVEAAVKYRIDDPLAYALNCKDAEKVVDGSVSGVLQRYVSTMDVDTLLTTGKALLAEDTKHTAQDLLSGLNLGVTLVNVELTKLTPPNEVKSDFDAVTEAAVKKKTLAEQANEYRVNTLPGAQSSAQKTIEEAKARQTSQLAKAQTDTAAFNGLYADFSQSPEMIREGVLQSRIDNVLAKMQVIVLDSPEDSPRILLP